MRERAPVTLLAAFALAACGPAAERGEPLSDATDAAPGEQAGPDILFPDKVGPPPADFAGEYRLAAIDGIDLNADFGVAASITEGRIAFSTPCVALAWDYTSPAPGRFVVAAQPQVPRPAAGTAECAGAPLPLESALFAAMNSTTSAETTKANGLRLFGERHSVLLFTQ